MEIFTPSNFVDLRVMSFNVLLDLPAVNNVPMENARNRMQALCKEIQTYKPALVGVQEDTSRWLNAFSEFLSEYRMVYSDEPIDKKSEHCTILWRNDLTCKAQGTQWLTSDGTKDTVALTVTELTGSVGTYALNAEEREALKIYENTPDAVLKERRNADGAVFEYLSPRRMTYAVVEADGAEILHVNTHFQHRGQKAPYITPALSKLRNFERLKQYRILCKAVENLKCQFPTAKVILTGDFNDVEDSDIYRTVSETYCDTAKQALQRLGYPGSWNCAYQRCMQGDNYPSENEGKDGGCIDYCFVQPGECMEVTQFQTGLGRADIIACDGTEKTIYTSDHLPIIVDFKIYK